MKLEQIVLEALQAGAPALVVEVPRPDSGRPDLAVWSDDLEPWVGNPLLIEVKARLRSAKDAQEVRDRLEAYIKHANAGWGLVLYADGLSHEWAQSLASPPVLFMRLDEFLAALRGHGLAAIIRAHHIIELARAEKRRLVVITADELAGLGGVDEMIQLLKIKLTQLSASGTSLWPPATLS